MLGSIWLCSVSYVQNITNSQTIKTNFAEDSIPRASHVQNRQDYAYVDIYFSAFNRGTKYIVERVNMILHH